MDSCAVMISRQWREGKVRPLLGNSPHDRPVSRGILSLKENLRRSLRCHWLPAPINTEAPQYAFFKAWRNLSVRCGQNKTKPWGGTVPPPDGRPRAQVKERVGRTTPFSSSAMSSGQLFLDRVGRHQSPSLLHRQPQINMHSAEPRAKGDISTLPERGHFYFALTTAGQELDKNYVPMV
jgi:hypothetical protein